MDVFDGFHVQLRFLLYSQIKYHPPITPYRYRNQDFKTSNINRLQKIKSLRNKRQKNKGHTYKMDSTLFIILIGLIGGIAVGLQAPMASMITQRLGIFESVFIVHVGGALVALLPLLLYSGGNVARWKELPWYTLLAGGFGLIVIGALSYMIPRVGVGAAVITIVAGQMLVSTVLDHFGWLGGMGRPMDPTRAIGLAVVLVGVWLTVK
jgi:transporter family-2 protein